MSPLAFLSVCNSWEWYQGQRRVSSARLRTLVGCRRTIARPDRESYGAARCTEERGVEDFANDSHFEQPEEGPIEL